MHKVVIYLKSGDKLVVKCTEFKVTKTDNKVTSITWEGLRVRRPLYISLEDISAIIKEY